MKFILGTKLGMTQVFADDGRVIPVTRLQAGPCVVTQVKQPEKDAVHAVQIGFGKQKMFRLNKAMQGHLRNLEPLRHIKDIRMKEATHGLERGDTFTVSIFEPGDKVQVTGTSKGKGFQGVVKRHGFGGSLQTHGHKDQVRMPGSIGAGGVQRVFKGTRMGGHMGDEQVTVKNLEIIEVHPEANELYVKGAVPGARGSLLLVLSEEGTITIDRQVAAEIVEEPVVEQAVESAPVEPAEQATTSNTTETA